MAYYLVYRAKTGQYELFDCYESAKSRIAADPRLSCKSFLTKRDALRYKKLLMQDTSTSQKTNKKDMQLCLQDMVYVKIEKTDRDRFRATWTDSEGDEYKIRLHRDEMDKNASYSTLKLIAKVVQRLKGKTLYFCVVDEPLVKLFNKYQESKPEPGDERARFIIKTMTKLSRTGSQISTHDPRELSPLGFR